MIISTTKTLHVTFNDINWNFECSGSLKGGWGTGEGKATHQNILGQVKKEAKKNNHTDQMSMKNLTIK